MATPLSLRLHGVDDLTARGDLWSSGHIQNGLGDLYRETHNLPAAHAAYEESLAQTTLVNDRWMMAWNYEGLAETTRREGRHQAGIRDYLRTLELFMQPGDSADARYIVERIADAMALLEMGAELAPILAALNAPRGQDEAALPDTLRLASTRWHERYPAEFASGRSMNLETVASALNALFAVRPGGRDDGTQVIPLRR